MRNHYVVAAIDRVGFVVLGLAWLILVYVTSHFYRKAVPRRRLWRTFGRATAIQAAFLVLELIVYLVSTQVMIARLTAPSSP
jgi:hypothetical protein